LTDPIQATRFQLVWEQILAIISSISLIDILDIAIVAFLIYKLLGLIRETRAGQLLKGVVAILLLFVISDLFEFRMLETILKYIITYGVLVLLVLFQPELRKVLEQVGRTSISSFQIFTPTSEIKEQMKQRTNAGINAIVDACTTMAQTKTGALIVIERQTKIGDIISTGTIIDANVCSELVQNIFFHNSPLHDGALVIRDDRLYAAGCFLPLSQNYEISRALGTRHRAALGMSEISDAVIIVVSEETGGISVAVDGKLKTKLTVTAFKSLLTHMLIINDEEDQKERKVMKLFRKKEN